MGLRKKGFMEGILPSSILYVTESFGICMSEIGKDRQNV